MVSCILKCTTSKISLLKNKTSILKNSENSFDAPFYRMLFVCLIESSYPLSKKPLGNTEDIFFL